MLSAQNLSVNVQGSRVLRGISFEIEAGELVCLVGRNGAGKTTILEAIAWALFDHLDYKRDDFVKRGTKRGHVAVAFISDLDGREYVVTRDTGGGYHVYDPETKTRLVEQKNQVTPWLCRHLGVDPAHTLMVGDFKFDILAGRNAGTRTALLTFGKRPSYLDEVEPDHLLERLDDLLKLF